MKRLIGIIIKPAEEIAKIGEDGLKVSSVIIFALAVIAGNIEVATFSIAYGLRYFLCSVALLVFSWAGLIFIADLIIAAVVGLVNPVSSSLLNRKRMRKLFMIQMNISVILVFRPLFSLIISSRLAWILIFIWGFTLVLVAVVHLWGIPEIKAALAVGVASALVLVGGRYLLNRGESVSYKSCPQEIGVERKEGCFSADLFSYKIPGSRLDFPGLKMQEKNIKNI